MNASVVARNFAAVVALALASVAAAYPDKPVQYIIPFAAGGESDIAARLQAQAFQIKYKQEMVVVNKPGAGGALAWSQTEQHAGRRAHDRRRQPAAHRAAAARARNAVQDRGHHAGLLLPLHARTR